VPPSFPDGLSAWTYSALDARQVIDPVNVLVLGANTLQTQELLARIGLLPVNRLERFSPPQYFRHRDNVHEADLSIATGRDPRDWLSRLHARLYHPPSDSTYGSYTACTAHVDEVAWRQDRCRVGEVAVSFSKGRAWFQQRLSDDHRVTRTIQTRSVGSVRQCDHRRTVVDGVVLLVDG